jgi:hypothetical protein
MAKWASRFQLGLSKTAPGLRLKLADILNAPDISLVLRMFSPKSQLMFFQCLVLFQYLRKALI